MFCLLSVVFSTLETPLIWVDLETTGTDLDKDHILEIDVIITDQYLRIVAEAPLLIVHQPKSVMDAMDPWCIEHHGAAGLTKF